MTHTTKVSAILKRTTHETEITQTRSKKIVINTCCGKFALGVHAMIRYKELSNKVGTVVHSHDIPRDDPMLVRVIQEMGDNANAVYSRLKIVEIPSDVDWYISEYDGIETIVERHRIWS